FIFTNKVSYRIIGMLKLYLI
ncbi:hypothetical protein D046_4665B, partial [Vibrio parahaemolyticus V-223/04]